MACFEAGILKWLQFSGSLWVETQSPGPVESVYGFHISASILTWDHFAAVQLQTASSVVLIDDYVTS